MNAIEMTENFYIMKPCSYKANIKSYLRCLDLRVFYVRLSKCVIDDSTPECLTLNHIPLSKDTLLEVNGVRTSIYSDGAPTLLRRDRVDKKSEEITFVSTDSVRMTGSVKFEVFRKDILVLSGVFELCKNNNGCIGEHENHGQIWSMNCESITKNGILKDRQYMGKDLDSPAIEVCVAGCCTGHPIILTRTLQLTYGKKQMRKGMLESIPEYEDTENPSDLQSRYALQVAECSNYKLETEDCNDLYSRMEYLEGEDGELSWFNAGVRVGVGIGLSICVGIGLGVGLLVGTYQGTTRNFRRHLL